jgi:hypothetical protein
VIFIVNLYNEVNRYYLKSVHQASADFSYPYNKNRGTLTLNHRIRTTRFLSVYSGALFDYAIASNFDWQLRHIRPVYFWLFGFLIKNPLTNPKMWSKSEIEFVDHWSQKISTFNQSVHLFLSRLLFLKKWSKKNPLFFCSESSGYWSSYTIFSANIIQPKPDQKSERSEMNRPIVVYLERRLIYNVDFY